MGIKLLSIDFLGIKYNCMHFPSIYFLFPLILLETLPDTLNSQSVMKSKSDEALMKAYLFNAGKLQHMIDTSYMLN